MILYFCSAMLPDYPHKLFNDKADNYFCLMEALAADSFLL